MRWLIAILLLPAVLAASYEVDVSTVDNTILSNESAVFQVVINNFGQQTERFQIYTFDTNWVIQVEPSSLTIPAENSREYTVRVHPKANIGYGTQGMAIMIKNLNEGIIQKESVIIHVADPLSGPRSYAPSVQLTAEVPHEVYPRDPLRVRLRMRNRNALNITNMTVRVDSPLFERTYLTNLSPLGERQDDISFQLDDYQEPGTYRLNIVLQYAEQKVSEVATIFTVPVVENVVENHQDASTFLRDETTLFVENKGNAPVVYNASLPTNRFRALFTNVEPDTDHMKVKGERAYVWQLELAPQERVQLVMVTNYRLLAVLFILAIAGVILYYLLRSPVIAVKETITQGDSSSLKVRIFVKNRMGKALEGVSVVDRIPSIASYVKEERLGVLNPTKIVNSKKGTLVKWEVDVLEPFEERILSYSLKSRLQIVGKLSLPAARVHFQSHGKERVTYTKSLNLDE